MCDLPLRKDHLEQWNPLAQFSSKAFIVFLTFDKLSSKLDVQMVPTLVAFVSSVLVSLRNAL